MTQLSLFSATGQKRYTSMHLNSFQAYICKEFPSLLTLIFWHIWFHPYCPAYLKQIDPWDNFCWHQVFPCDPLRPSIRKQPPTPPPPASLKLPLGTRRFCPSRLHVLLKDLLIGTLYSRSSFSHQAAALLSVYICSGSISQGCLFLRESSEVSPAFRSENLPKSTAKKLKIDAVLIHQQPLWELH